MMNCMDRAAKKVFFKKEKHKFEARYKYDICRGISQEHIFSSYTVISIPVQTRLTI